MPPEGEKMESRERVTALRLRLEICNEEQDELLAALLEDAEQYALAYTGRDSLPAALEGTVLELAMLRYHRRGMEGETVHSEGGLQMSMEGLPAALEKLLNRYRKARAV